METAKTTPPFLKAGSRVGMVCPSSKISYPNAISTCAQTLQEWGFEVILGKTVFTTFHNFSDTDNNRLSDLQALLDREDIHAILCARGGYGMSRIIDKIDFSHFLKHPKWIIGFSDITLLLNHLYARYQIPSLHAPMAGAFYKASQEGDKIYILNLYNTLIGKPPCYSIPTHALNKKGVSTGVLVGGNLSILLHSIGTPSAWDPTGKILFIEDIDEYQYRIDRMIIQLKRTGILNSLAGLIIGSFSHVLQTTTPFGTEINTMIAEHLSEYNYPICFEFPVGHETANNPLIIGGTYRLSVQDQETRIEKMI
ncbi:MAG: LD-carboxypeptidase [Phycisphaerales bacterium]|nr:LD-carboxypeptidase [Phycisphaerales bacterium]